MKNYFLLFCFFILFSCNDKVEITYHDNGKIRKEYHLINGVIEGSYKEFFNNGKLKESHFYKRGKKIDTTRIYSYEGDLKVMRVHLQNGQTKYFDFYENGKIKKEGILDDKFINIGKWKFYSNEGDLTFIREYISINGNSYLNQVMKYNEDGYIFYYPSHYFEIFKTKDTFSLNDPFRAAAIIGLPIFKEKKSEIYVVVPKNGFNFNKDFSNGNEIELDTFYNLKKDTINQKWFPEDDFSLTVAFGKKFEKIGNHNVRGFIVEYYEQEPDSLGIIKKEHIKYFEVPIYVKDTIE